MAISAAQEAKNLFSKILKKPVEEVKKQVQTASVNLNSLKNQVIQRSLQTQQSAIRNVGDPIRAAIQRSPALNPNTPQLRPQNVQPLRQISEYVKPMAPTLKSAAQKIGSMPLPVNTYTPFQTKTPSIGSSLSFLGNRLAQANTNTKRFNTLALSKNPSPQDQKFLADQYSNFLLGGISSGGKNIFKLDKIYDDFQHVLVGSPLVRNITSKLSKSQLDDYASRLARIPVSDKLEPSVNDAIKIAKYIQGTKEGLLVNKPSIGLSVQKVTGKQQEAKEKLGDLLTYSDDLKRRGFSTEQINRISLKDYQKLYGQAPKSVAGSVMSKMHMGKLSKAFNPLKTLDPDIQDDILKWDARVKTAQVDADRIAGEFKAGFDPKKEWDLVRFSQDPIQDTAERLKLSTEDVKKGQELIDKHRDFNDLLFERAQKEGIDLNYLRNHIVQAWNETPEQIEELLRARGLGQKPGFSQRRFIKSFEEGQELGLTPKFTSFGQLNALAQHELDKAVANKELFQKLIDKGKIVAANQPNIPRTWKTIEAPFFPQAVDVIDENNTVVSQYKAPPEIADFLNNLLGTEEKGIGAKGLRMFAKVSGSAQDILLSGGVGPLNFFGIGQLVKEGTSGRFFTPMKAFARALIPGASKAYQQQNNKLIREMATQGISSRGVTSYQKLYKNVAEHKGITKVLGENWSKYVNEPTFGKFLNELQIGYYKDTKDALLKNGKYSEEQAIKIAADATKNFYGLSTSIGRSKELDDVIQTVFLAPKYRESMINVFSNLAKSLNPKTLNQPELNGLRKLSVGMALTYGMYNVMQKQLTGKFMWENPPGKEFELVIPTGKPDEFVSIPWMPGFTALPRRIVGTATSLVRGDVPEAKKQFSGLFSVPLGRGLELWANRDYFGRPIYGEGTEVKDVALYGAKSFLPGYGRAVIDVASGKSSPLFGVSQALELPIKQFNSSPAYDEAEKFRKAHDAEYDSKTKLAEGYLKTINDLQTVEEKETYLKTLVSENKLDSDMIDTIINVATNQKKRDDSAFVKSVRMSSQSNEKRAIFIVQYLRSQPPEEKNRLFNELVASDVLTEDMMGKLVLAAQALAAE